MCKFHSYFQQNLKQTNRPKDEPLQQSVDPEEVAYIKAIQKQFGDKMDYFNAKVFHLDLLHYDQKCTLTFWQMIGFDISLNSNQQDISKFERSFEELKDTVLLQQQDIDDILLYNQPVLIKLKYWN